MRLKKFRGIEDLKSNFYKLAHQYHPDKNPDEDSQMFRDILGAYEFALRHLSALCQHFGVEEEPEDEQTAKTSIENLDDIFEDIFGFSKSGRVLGYQEPQVLYLTLEELIFGAKKRKKLVAYEKCPACQGFGAATGSIAKVCNYCFGHGVIRRPEHFKEKKKVCPKCRGRGRNIIKRCPRCDGFGRLKRFHRQEFTLPVGMRAFEVYTLSSYDLDSKTQTEIFVESRLLRHPIFQIDNYDLLCQYQLDFQCLEKALRLHVSTPFGKVPIRIPADANKGDVIRIKGAGLFKDKIKKNRGDLIVTLAEKRGSIFRRILGGLFGK